MLIGHIWTTGPQDLRIPDAQKIFPIGLSANLLSNIQTLINPDLYVKLTNLNFSQCLSTLTNVYYCKGRSSVSAEKLYRLITLTNYFCQNDYVISSQYLVLRHQRIKMQFLYLHFETVPLFAT